MTNFKKIFAALALVAASSSVAMAQTDFGSGMGAGAGAGGVFAPFAPGLAGAGTAPGLTGNGATGLNTARSQFLNASSSVRVPNAGGGNSELPANVMQAIGGVLGGSPTGTQVTTFTNALAGVPAGAVSTLVAALQALGTSSTRGNLVAALNAYNAAIDAVPAGSNPPAALAAVRYALFQATKQ